LHSKEPAHDLGVHLFELLSVDFLSCYGLSKDRQQAAHSA